MYIYNKNVSSKNIDAVFTTWNIYKVYKIIL